MNSTHFSFIKNYCFLQNCMDGEEMKCTFAPLELLSPPCLTPSHWFAAPLPSQEPCHGCELHSPPSPPHNSLLHLLAAILLNFSTSQNTKKQPLHHIEQRKRKLKEHSHQLWMSQDWKKNANPNSKSRKHTAKQQGCTYNLLPPYACLG